MRIGFIFRLGGLGIGAHWSKYCNAKAILAPLKVQSVSMRLERLQERDDLFFLDVAFLKSGTGNSACNFWYRIKNYRIYGILGAISPMYYRKHAFL
ncbi:MAG TPA: hypothetical protein VF427_09770 [Noviherbaspirillum sp.]